MCGDQIIPFQLTCVMSVWGNDDIDYRYIYPMKNLAYKELITSLGGGPSFSHILWDAFACLYEIRTWD